MFPFTFAPKVEYPLSGDVVQDIAPSVFSADIAGDAEAEYRIHRNVASYGTQLDKILAALEVIAAKVEVDLPEIQDLQERVTAEKQTHRESLRRRAEEALSALKDADESAWHEVRALDV